MNTMTTYSGRKFDPMQMTPGDVYIEDIAHALSLLCRGGGQLTYFYSVGQHSLNCAAEAKARGWSKRQQLACLLHDASEAYMSDVPRPFKQHLSDYISHEKTLLDIVYTKYLGSRLDEEEEKKVKEIDDDMLYYDLKILLRGVSEEAPPIMKTHFSYEVLPFEVVEKRYLELFERYSREL